MNRLASLLAVLAVFGVVGTAAFAVRDYLDRPSGAAGSERVFADGQLVSGANDAQFEVPTATSAWTLESSDTAIYYVDQDGEPSVGVVRPAIYTLGYCTGGPGDSHRAFVGFTPSADASQWVDAISLDQDLTTSSRHTRIETTTYTLGDGRVAVRSTSIITLTDPGRCDPPRISFTMLTWDAGGPKPDVTNLVLVRDAGTPGALPGKTAEKILQSVR